MHYLIQENLFRDANYHNLTKMLNRLQLSYEDVQVFPEHDNIKYSSNRNDIFPFGSVKMARISKNLDWKPGSMFNENHDYNVYKDFYKEHLLNYDSKIINFHDNFDYPELFFARPTKDSKFFTGQVFTKDLWNQFQEKVKSVESFKRLRQDFDIQVSSVKNIQHEIRFFIVGGEPITASKYKLGNQIFSSDIVDSSAYDFCREMIKIFQLNDAFVLDVCLTDGEYKIVECNCINCSGFYHIDIQKLLMSLEDFFN